MLCLCKCVQCDCYKQPFSHLIFKHIILALELSGLCDNLIFIQFCSSQCLYAIAITTEKVTLDPSSDYFSNLPPLSLKSFSLPHHQFQPMLFEQNIYHHNYLFLLLIILFAGQEQYHSAFQ
jgi:hypothetical protein